MSRLLLLIAAGAIVLGAQTPVGGPSLGFIFDVRGQALRPILGIPGASSFGDPIQTPAPLSSGAISLRQNVAIVNDGAWKAVGITAAAPGTVVLPDGLPVSARVTVSESGAAAAFYDADNSALSVVTGIASSSMAANSVSLDALPGAITALATSDDGSLLLSASVPDGGETLFWIGQDGSMRQLASLQSTASIRLWNHGAHALVVDRGANQVWKIQDPGGNAAITLLASDADGVAGPTGAALSAHGKQLWIANAGAHTVLGLDTTSRATVTLNCGFDLTVLLPMADGQTFRLNELDSGPLWLLDATPGADPRIVFVPAVPAATTPEEAAQ
jgi:hypothetical protein